MNRSRWQICLHSYNSLRFQYHFVIHFNNSRNSKTTAVLIGCFFIEQSSYTGSMRWVANKWRKGQNLFVHRSGRCTAHAVHLCNLPLQLHADLSVSFRNGHNHWILYPEGSVYSSGLSLQECSFWLGSKKVRFYGRGLRSEFKGIEQWLN